MDTSPPLPSASRRTPERSLPPSSPSRRSITNTKPRKLPTVTPRRFNRFFAPRQTQQPTPQTSRSTRMPLGDISYAGANRQTASSSPIKNSRRLLDQEDDVYSLGSSPPEKATPVKRICLIHPDDRPAIQPGFLHDDIPSSPPPVSFAPIQFPPRPVKRSAFRDPFSYATRTVMGDSARSVAGTKPVKYNTEWLSETSGFFSGEFHKHKTVSCLPDSGNKRTVPFSVATCHNSTVVAVSDEEGYIRLLDSERCSDRYPFEKAMTHWQAHKNSILSLEFSEDDMHLATAAGDRTALVIDVQKQKTLYTMFAHKSSLRQVRFQPGSGGQVLATAGRDGMVAIWDLRCKPEKHDVSVFNTHGNSECVFETRKYAQWIHSFMPPVFGQKEAGRRVNAASAEMSVTALSFLNSEQPHIMLSGSASSAGICLWDMRQMRTKQTSSQNALLSKAFPSSENASSRGVVAMSLSPNTSRLYALCKDSTLYAYSVAEMLCKGSKSPVKALYGFRNPALQATNFYGGVSTRPASADGSASELIAVAGGGCLGPVIIPANERYLEQYGGIVKSNEERQGVKMYNHGSVLSRGHSADLCDVSFTNEGNLISVGDDSTIRVWYEDRREIETHRAWDRQCGPTSKRFAYSEPVVSHSTEESDNEDF